MDGRLAGCCKGWKFPRQFQISLYVSRVESGIDTGISNPCSAGSRATVLRSGFRSAIRLVSGLAWQIWGELRAHISMFILYLTFWHCYSVVSNVEWTLKFTSGSDRCFRMWQPFSRGWKFLWWSQISPYWCRLESGINTEIPTSAFSWESNDLSAWGLVLGHGGILVFGINVYRVTPELSYLDLPDRSKCVRYVFSRS